MTPTHTCVSRGGVDHEPVFTCVSMSIVVWAARHVLCMVISYGPLV